MISLPRIKPPQRIGSLAIPYRVLVSACATAYTLPAHRPACLPDAMCTTSGRNDSYLTLRFHDANLGLRSPALCTISSDMHGTAIGASCRLCARENTICPHIVCYTHALDGVIEGRTEPLEPNQVGLGLRQAKPSMLDLLLERIGAGQEPRRDNPRSLGLVVSQFAIDNNSLPRLAVTPFTYRPADLADAGDRIVSTGRDFDQLPQSVREDLLVLCGLPPYGTSPVVSDEQESAFIRNATRGLLCNDDGVYGYSAWSHGGGRRLHIGETIEPRFEWTFGEYQRLKVDFGIEGATPCVCGRHAWAYDKKNRMLHPVSGSIKRIELCINPPMLEHDEADRVSAAAAAALLEAGLPLPWKPSAAKRLDGAKVLDVVTIDRSEAPGLALSSGMEHPLTARVERTYDGVVFPSRPAAKIEGRAVALIDGELYSLPEADPSAPGASPVDPTVFRQSANGQMLPVAARGQSLRAAWINAVEHLRRQGTEVVLGDGVNLQPDAHLAGQRPTISVVEVDGRNAYEFGIPIEVAGREVDLGQVLPTLMADTRFLALIDKGDLDDRTWAIDLPDGTVLSAPVRDLERLAAPIIEWLRAAGGKRPRLSSLQVASLDPSINTERCARVQALRRGIERLVSTSDTPATEPVGFAGKLRPYQSVGLGWLNRLAECGFGGVLADDMGLGKTVQVLAHIQTLKLAGKLSSPALVVCPTSVTWNWEREAAAFVPGLRVLCVRGSATTREDLLAHTGQYDLLITSYALALRDREALEHTAFSLLVLDEAQQVKNARSKGSVLLRSLSVDRALVVTGTPIENHLGEFHTLFDYALPGVLGDEAMFRANFRNPIEKHGNTELRSHLTRMVSPFILRRRKDVVASDLPPKTIETLRADLEPSQRRLYEQLRAAAYIEVKSEIAERGLAQSSIAILAALMKLRQACADPRLVKLSSARYAQGSAKLDLLLDLLTETLANGRRTLVFSTFTEMLDIIEGQLRSRGIPCLKLTGATHDRQELVDAFQAGDVPVFLISLKAGGSGLNLTAADTVIHYDPWWNQAAEDQATDRAHRIGQTKPVLVYKLIAGETLEEHILAMQARKAELARAILDDGAVSSATFTEEDIEALFGTHAAPPAN